MLGILLVLLGVTAGFILLLRLLYAYLMKIAEVAGSSFERRMQDANFIAQTGMVPPRWVKQADHKKSQFGGKLAKWKVRRRLSRMIGYFRSTTLVKDETTRVRLLRQLRSAYKQWRPKEWDDIVPSDKPGTGFPYIYNN